MLRPILLIILYFLINSMTQNSQANLIQTVPECKKLKSYPLNIQENIPGFPKPLAKDEDDPDILEEYYASIAIAYADEANRQKKQAHEKRKLATQQIGRASADNLRHGRSSNPFSIGKAQSFGNKITSFALQLRNEAAILEKNSQENLNKGNYFLCVAENIDKFLNTKGSMNEK